MQRDEGSHLFGFVFGVLLAEVILNAAKDLFQVFCEGMQNDSQQRGLRWLNIGRWWICGTGLCVIAPLVPAMFHNYRKWHAAIGGDASLADFWRTEFYLGIARFAAELLVVIAIFFVLKPRPGMFNIAVYGGSAERPRP